MRRHWPLMIGSCSLMLLSSLAQCQEFGSPQGIAGERSLLGRQAYVAADALQLCKPEGGVWVDLGAGRGEVAIALVESAANPVVLVDPNAEALAAALQTGREKGIANRLIAVVGRAEALPFPDDSVDFVVSRGSIFFWDDPSQGLKEVYRVLRSGGKAYIGGGAGSGFPEADAEKLIQERKASLQGDDAEKWKRFVELRRPEQMTAWAEAAGLCGFQVLGQGAISVEDERVGQGVWLLFEKGWDFDSAQAAALPNGWVTAKTGQGPGSVWCVAGDATAPSGDQVLAQTSSEGPHELFNLCVLEGAALADLDLSVSFKSVSGELDRGGGLVWRYQNANNYYVARHNPLEENYRVYKVVGGNRTQLQSADVKAASGEWHKLRVVHHGNHIQGYLDGQLHLDVKDDSFAGEGAVGLWTKADAVTSFDDLSYRSLRGEAAGDGCGEGS